MDDLDKLLQDLADDPGEFARQGGLVLFRRHGEDIELNVRETPGVGPELSGLIGDRNCGWLPARRFIQESVLQLHRLAVQISRVVERANVNRPSPYINGPAAIENDGEQSRWAATDEELRRFLSTPDFGTTRLLELMADAGQGKTILLEQVAHKAATSYVPDQYPQPILLIVDLLGRYVGTVDDAIAGALNNAYRFPGLSQRDVALAVRERWLVLALDGFDELVARVGARDAFLRITELLDQLDNSGTVILSARSAFFELYQVSSAVRSYLKPRKGSYTTASLRLLPWTEEQGRRVFESLGSQDATADLHGLLDAFGGDSELILQPFHLTRLAALWRKGEKFSDAASRTDRRWRTAFIIGELIEREAQTKWTDPSKQAPLLSTEHHAHLLEGISEEMWRTGTFRLSAEELRIASQIAISDLGLAPTITVGVEERIATHAALTARERGFSFIHDRFFYYYLGRRLASALRDQNWSLVMSLLIDRELPPEVCSWIEWILREEVACRSAAVRGLVDLAADGSTKDATGANVGLLVPRLLRKPSHDVEVRGLTFVGDGFRGNSYQGSRFHACSWWQSDLIGATFSDCEFIGCVFGDFAIDRATRFDGSTFGACEFKGVDVRDHRQVFDPAAIVEILRQRGARVVDDRRTSTATIRSVAGDIVVGLGKLVRKAERSCDVAVEEFEELLPEAKAILKLGINTEVLRKSERTTSGSHKDFYRFRVDKQEFLRGEAGLTGDERVDKFWEELERRFPARRE